MEGKIGSRFIDKNQKKGDYVAWQLPVARLLRMGDSMKKYGYVSGYSRPSHLDQQSRILNYCFPHLATYDASLEGVCNAAYAEGKLLLPYWGALGPTYNDALQAALSMLAQVRRRGEFLNLRPNEMGANVLRQTDAKMAAIDKLRRKQPDQDFLLIDGQLGQRFPHTTRYSAETVLCENEFLFGAFEVAIFILTHPERMDDFRDMSLECAGDECRLALEGPWEDIPFFQFDGQLNFNMTSQHVAHPEGSIASGFLPR